MFKTLTFAFILALLFAAAPATADSNLHILEGVLMYCNNCQEDGTCDGYFFTNAPNSEYNAFEAKVLGSAATQCVAWTAAFQWHQVRFTFWIGREWSGSAYETVIRGNNLQDLGEVASP